MTQPPDSRLIPDTQAFLTQLSTNNTRDWFHENKARYEAELKAPALVLLDTVGAELDRMTGAHVAPKLFRPQRDVRFSRDKTPYHLHLHLLWGMGGSSGPVGTGFFFGIQRDRVMLGAGCMGMTGAALNDFRDRVAGPDGAELEHLLSALTQQGFRMDPPELKRVPPAHDKTHPRAALLRRKSLTLWQDMKKPPTDLRTALVQGFSPLLPVIRWLAD